MTTLAEFNNNPGNIRPPKGVTYEGQIGVDENGFAIFQTYEKGREALIRELKFKIEKQGLKTPEDLINRWAPSGSENPEDARANYKIFLTNTLGLDGTNKPFPKGSVDKIADAIEQFERGGVKVETPQAPEPVEPPSEQDFQAKKAQIALDLMGAGAGAGVAKVLDVGKNISETAKAIRSLPTAIQGATTPVAPPGASPAAPAAPLAARPMQPPAGGPAGPVGGPAGPTSPVRMMGGPGAYNYGKAFGLTDIEAGRALDMTKNPGGANDLIRQRAEALQRIQQMGGGYVENPRFGGLMTPEASAGRGPRASYVQGTGGLSQLPPRQAVPTAPLPPQGPGALSQMLGGARDMTRAALNIPIVRGGLGGLGVAEQGVEAYRRAGEGDPTGAAIAGAGALGGAMMMTPNPAAIGIGAAISAASPLTLYLRDKIKNQPAMPPPSPRELREAENPAFVFPAP